MSLQEESEIIKENNKNSFLKVDTLHPSTISQQESPILHILCVQFHHRNGPQVELVHPLLPEIKSDNNNKSNSIITSGYDLPDEWSFMCFTCLPDGAHATEEEFIYFHLPPVPSWGKPYDRTVFGLACFRQIPTDQLLSKTADMTRTTVQKSIVILSKEPILGSIRSKLGLVTRAFFEQKDFSQTEILHIIFFGHKIEKMTAYQYGLVSLIPDLLRNVSDVGSSKLEFYTSASIEVESMLSPLMTRAWQFNMPLVIFGEQYVWLPYIPLQQIDVLLSPDTKGYLIGTSNAIFTQHKGLAADIIVLSDDATVNIPNPSVNALAQLTASDKKFMEEMIKLSQTLKEEDDPSLDSDFGYQGSDDDIRNRFERYLYSLLIATQMTEDIPLPQPNGAPPKHLTQAQIYADYNTNWVKAFLGSDCFKYWSERAKVSPVPTSLVGPPSSTAHVDEASVNSTTATTNNDDHTANTQQHSVVGDQTQQSTHNIKKAHEDRPHMEVIPAGHPCQGTTIFSAVFGNKWQEISKSVAPIQNQVGKAISEAETSIKDAVGNMKDPKTQQKIQASATQMFASMSSWYSQRKKELTAMIEKNANNQPKLLRESHPDSADDDENQEDAKPVMTDEEYELIENEMKLEQQGNLKDEIQDFQKFEVEENSSKVAQMNFVDVKEEMTNSYSIETSEEKKI